MSELTTKYPFLGPQFDAIARELSRLAIACEIDVEQAGLGDRIIKNDDSVCGRRNPEAFRKLREHMMGLSSLEVKALEKLEPEELRAILDEVWGEVLKLRATGRPEGNN